MKVKEVNMQLSFGRAVVPVTNQSRTLQFYTDVLGCTVIHDGPGPNGLRFVHVGFEGQGNVGLWLFHFDQFTPSSEPILVLYTDNLDEVYAQMKEKLVTIVHEPSQNETSRFMHVADSDGNIIVLVQML